MKNVLITGAGRGIGLALTKEFLSEGFKVIATFRNEAKAKELLQLATENKNLITVVADVTSDESLANLKKVLSNNNNIDILINNSGVIGERGKSLIDLNLQNLNDVLNVNTLGPMRVCKVAIPHMNSNATIAQISSLMGSIEDNAGGGYYDYRMSKTALNMFNKCLSIEFPNFTCLVLHPGWVQTEMGGQGATVPSSDCAKGLFKLISSLKKNQSGKFFDYSGKELPW